MAGPHAPAAAGGDRLQAGNADREQVIARHGSVIITFGSAALLNISALVYAVTR